ncbi:hypothetical protein [Chthonomonas calidirosea]|uniref:hypothetical protein n=1 Tax=Chthonomonas calidirosea TaxID=454171 RepID=UPI000399AD89|nr:hypothetical protein [Chthonomonas calidirosea]
MPTGTWYYNRCVQEENGEGRPTSQNRLIRTYTHPKSRRHRRCQYIIQLQSRTHLVVLANSISVLTNYLLVSIGAAVIAICGDYVRRVAKVEQE